MNSFMIAALGTSAVSVAVVLVTATLNLRNVRRGLGPDRRAIRIQVLTHGIATLLFALLGMASIAQSGLGLVAILPLPFAAVGLLLIQKAWMYH